MKQIIVDSHYVCHAAKYVLPTLSYGERGTGVVFGFLSRVLGLAETFKCRNFIFAWESPGGHRELKRRALYSGYKERAGDRAPEEVDLDRIAVPQFGEVRSCMLPDLGFRCQLQVPGYEADDVIAKVIADNPEDEFVVVSRDEDLYQLLRPNVVMYDPKEKRVFSAADFYVRYGIPPRLWVKVKTLAGCSGDGVPGVKGVAEKTALRYVLGELPPHYKTWNAIRAAESKGETELARRLVKLPFDDELPDYRLGDSDEFRMDRFIKVCERYGFRSFLVGNQIDLWRKLFVDGGR